MRRNIWLFQALNTYRLVDEVRPLIGKSEYWRPMIHLKEMNPEDDVILWQAGSDAGAYALGRLAGKPYQRGGEWRVDITYRKLLHHPHYKSDLQRHRVLSSLRVLSMPWAANPFPVTQREWKALLELDRVDQLNIFTHYKQKEDQFTNGLVSLLALSKTDGNSLLRRFLGSLLGLRPSGGVNSFRVLRLIEGTADAELAGPNCCIRLETKITPDSLRDDQVRRHIERLCDSAKATKALVLLSPDAGSNTSIRKLLESGWIRQICRKQKGLSILPLEWKHVYKFFEESATSSEFGLVFSELIRQYLREIQSSVFEHDYVGVIQKIAFGDESKVYPETTSEHDGYLDLIERGAWGSGWNTPTKFKKLDAKGRKLLLYDPHKKEIKVEVEVSKVAPNRSRGKYKFTNTFSPKTLKTLDPPIPLSRIKATRGFENFTRGMASVWNLTREQFQSLQGAE